MRYSAGLLALAMMLVVGLCALGTSCTRPVSAASTPAGSSGTVLTARTTAAQEKLPEGLTDDLSKAMHVPPDDIRSDLEARGAVVNMKDGSILVPIPEEEAIFGSPEGDGAYFHPQFRATVPAYYIAAHEVTNAQWKRFVEATAHDMTWLDSYFYATEAAYYYDPANEDRPAVCVLWDDARAYCEWADLRLPTELEWERGARGTDGRTYPWGDEWDSTRCQCSERQYGDTRNPSCVWSHPRGCSPDGLFDMSGNVWEWCADFFVIGAHIRYAAGDLTPPESGALQLRGGSYQGIPGHEFRCDYRHPCVYPANRFPWFGFRCARDLPAN